MNSVLLAVLWVAVLVGLGMALMHFLVRGQERSGYRSPTASRLRHSASRSEADNEYADDSAHAAGACDGDSSGGDGGGDD